MSIYRHAQVFERIRMSRFDVRRQPVSVTLAYALAKKAIRVRERVEAYQKRKVEYLAFVGGD